MKRRRTPNQLYREETFLPSVARAADLAMQAVLAEDAVRARSGRTR